MILSSWIFQAGPHGCRVRLKSDLTNFHLISTSFTEYPCQASALVFLCQLKHKGNKIFSSQYTAKYRFCCPQSWFKLARTTIALSVLQRMNYIFEKIYERSISLPLNVINLYFSSLFKSDFQYNWPRILYQLQVCSAMIWCVYVLQNDHYNEPSQHPSPYIITAFFSFG